MKRIIILTTFALACAASTFAAPATMRVDYYHTGNEKQEYFSLDRIVIEPLPWAGNLARSIDDTNLGKYFFEVIDAASGTTLYSRGFASVYGEWETTGEAQKMNRTFSESLRFPAVDKPARVSVKKRDAKNAWQEIWTFAIDPKDKFISKGLRTPAGPLMKLHEAGDPATKLDLLILGDGYTGKQRDEFIDDVHRLTGALFATEPFLSRKADFNCRAILAPAAQPGITDPRRGGWSDTPLGLSFNAFDVDRYMLTFQDEALRELAAQAPYDAIIVLGNTKKYGGGGIYGLWSTCAAKTEVAAYVFVHEFGHGFGGLADEYYTSQVAYEQFTPAGSEPWEPNVTALLDAKNLKWKDLVAEATPLPTPWNQEAYDQVDLAYQKKRAEAIAKGADDATSDALMREVKAQRRPLLEGEKFFGKVGAFEGAAYEAKKLYRPELDCIMFTQSPKAFCRVCERAIARVIDTYVR
jgi:hypothetical protein